MKLTRNERAALLAGGTPQIVRDTKPDVEPGARIVLAHSKPKRYWDETTRTVFAAPREPSVWITVTKIVRHRKGGWVVRYDLADRREPALLLAKGGGYTTDPAAAIDKIEAVVSDKDRRRLAMESRQRRAEQTERDEEQARRQKRAFRARLEESLRGLSPKAQQMLLAHLERQLREVGSETSDRAA